MALINISNLSFGHSGSASMVFENINLKLDTNWKLGFIGRNGRGKTTFLNLLLNKYQYRGDISACVKFEYYPYEVKNKNKPTAEVFEEICPEAEDWEILCELEKLGVSGQILQRNFKTLSPGQQAKVLLSALFLAPNAFLLIDEPTNHLDSATRELVKKYLKQKSGYILVSHDRALLDECVDHILTINKTGLELQRGNFSSWWQNKQQEDEFERAQSQKLKKDINRLTETAKCTQTWANKVEKSKNQTTCSGLKPDKGYVGHQAAKMMKRAKNVQARSQAAAEEKAALLKNIESAPVLAITPLKHHSTRLLELSHLSISYEGREVCQDVNFSLMQGERVAICGKNGCGKSSILNLIKGAPITYTGKVFKASGLKISAIAQSTTGLCGQLQDFALAHNLNLTRFLTILRKLDFSRGQFEIPLESYSEGQKKKVLLAASLCEPAHLYVWDEPLNYIDIFSRIQIEELILKHSPSLLFVEHDTTFVSKIATKTVTLS